MKNKNPLLFLLFFLLAVPVYSIELTTPDWEIVADGISISKPAETSWGYVTVTDGRTLIGWTENGRKCFQRKLKRKPSELLCVDYSDFIWSVSYDRKYVSLLNPDGVFLWEVCLPECCSYTKLIPGKDGRIFIPLENMIVCYDINGTKVWEYILDSDVLRFRQLEDGSLLCNEDIRLSPFGEILSETFNEKEELTGSSEYIVHTATCDFLIPSDSATSVLIAQDSDGSELWRKSFSPEKVFHYEITDSTIMTLGESWVIAGYVYNSSPVKRQMPVTHSDRIYFQSFGNCVDEDNYKLLVNGLKSIITKANQTEINPAMRNIVYDLRYLKQAEESGFDFSSLLAEIILKETDTAVLESAVLTAGTIGRDPEGLVFNAIDTRIKQSTSFHLDSSMYASFCECIYQICMKSGTDERLYHALEIVLPLISSDYLTIVHNNAAETVEKLILLQAERLKQ